jgi:hypothetical protein
LSIVFSTSSEFLLRGGRFAGSNIIGYYQRLHVLKLIMSNKDASRLSIRPVSVQEHRDEKSGAAVENVEVAGETPIEVKDEAAAIANKGSYIVSLNHLLVSVHAQFD